MDLLVTRNDITPDSVVEGFKFLEQYLVPISYHFIPLLYKLKSYNSMLYIR